MENELQILKNIESNQKTTQRDIAMKTGMSLGSVNVLIKRLLNKGMLKMERLNPRTIQYILTPKGMKEKAEATYRYVVRSYRFLNEIETQIDCILDTRLSNRPEEVILLGEEDEIYQLLINRLKQKKTGFKHYRQLDEDIKKSLTTKAKLIPVIIIWHPDYEEMLEKSNVEYINILQGI